MTEAEWLSATDPSTLLEFLEGRASERKLRLFCCGCCRRIWELMVDPTSRQAVEVAELFADGLGSEAERRRLSKRYYEATSFPTWQMNSSGAAGWAVARPLTATEAGHCAAHAVHAVSAH
jgi:hypothetical protein